MSQRNRLRYSRKQSEIVETESRKISDACKGNQIPSKNISECYYPSHNSHRLLIPNLKDDYILPIFFGVLRNFIVLCSNNSLCN